MGAVRSEEHDRIVALHRQAVAENSALRPVAAHRLLRRALAGLRAFPSDDVPAVTLHTQILITLAKVESELHGWERGFAVLGEAAALAQRGADPTVQVALRNQRGLLLLRFGRMRAAIEEFDRAEEHFSTAPPQERGNVLLNRATACMLLGELGRARRDLTRCAEIAHADGLRVLEYMARHNLGYLDFLRGDLPGALRTMEQASAEVEIRSIALLDRARVLMEAGLVREADEALAEAARILGRDRMTQDLAETELERARCALVSGDTAATRRFAGSARDRFRRRRSDSWRRTAELVLLQGDLAAGRPGRRLVGPALRVREELAAEGLAAPARTAGLIAVEALVSSGELDAAARLLGQLGRSRRNDPISSRLHARYVAALLDATRGRPGASGRAVQQGLAELANYQASFGSIDVQAASAVHGRQLAELGLSVALRGGRPEQVFTAAEQARAVSTRLPSVRPPRDVHTADLLSELRQTVESLRAAERDPRATARLERRRTDLERRIAGSRWTMAGAGTDAQPVATLDEVCAVAASADAVMVTYVQAGGALHAVVVDAAGARLVQLGPSATVLEQIRRIRADLDALANGHLPASLTGAVAASLRRSADHLDACLLRPLDIGSRRLAVVSTGALGQVPWNLLPSLRWIPVEVSSSATAWLAARRRRPGRRRVVVAVCGPDLDRAEQEVAGVEAAWPGATLHRGAEAERRRFVRAMSGAAVLHVAAHGVHHTENPMFSSLRLEDGVLFAHELDQTVRAPEHVVLSACELGLATVRPGDEALGLTSVLLRLGARSVVAGIARVGDDVAAETMIDYHKRLAAGADSAAALAEATADRAAPFVCFGATWRLR